MSEEYGYTFDPEHGSGDTGFSSREEAIAEAKDDGREEGGAYTYKVAPLPLESHLPLHMGESYVEALADNLYPDYDWAGDRIMDYWGSLSIEVRAELDAKMRALLAGFLEENGVLEGYHIMDEICWHEGFDPEGEAY